MHNKTWCVYPFVHLATFTNGDVTPCCVAKPYVNVNLNNLTIAEVWNHDKIKSVREKLLKGEEVYNCKNCYEVEKHGVDSHRTSSNRIFEKEYGITEHSFTSSDIPIENLITLDLRLGNTCNLKCIMCRPNESHKWYDDILELNKKDLPSTVKNDIQYKTQYDRNDYNWINKKVFWDNIDEILPNIKEFIFGGGEPFMLKEVKTLLHKAIECGSAVNTNIRFHTNGTYLSHTDFELFKKFKRVQLMFSVDSVNEINYFLRFPADWNKIIESININELYSANVQSYILCSLTGVSAFYLDKLYDYVAMSNWKKLPVENIILGRVHYPIYLNPQCLDSKRKETLHKNWNKIMTKYPHVSKTLQENLNWILTYNNDSNIVDMVSYINNMLDIRKIPPTALKEFLNDKFMV